MNNSLKAHQLHQSKHPSVNRFGLGKGIDVSIHKSSQMIGKGQKKPKGYATSILEPVLNHARVATASQGLRTSAKQQSPGKQTSSMRENQQQSATGRSDAPKIDTKLITGNGSENNIIKDEKAGPITPNQANQSKLRMMKTTYDVTQTDGGFLINYHHSSAKKKKTPSRGKNTTQYINEDLLLFKNSNEQRAASMTASDKNIEIAMRTNDIFSSQQDDEELLINLHNNNS